MYEMNSEDATKDIDADVVSDNFHSTLDILDESADISQSRVDIIEEMMTTGEVSLNEDDVKRVKRLGTALKSLLDGIADEDEPEEQKDRNRKLLEEMEGILNKLTRANIKAEAIIKEDQHAFISIADAARNQSEMLTNSSQGMTYNRLLSGMLMQYLETNKISSSVIIHERPNFFVENSLHLKRIHQIFIKNFRNKQTRTGLCLGCWKFTSMETTLTKNRKYAAYKDKHYPLIVKFSFLVQTKNHNIMKERRIFVHDLIYFLYHTEHQFITEEAKKIFLLDENKNDIQFVPFPLINLALSEMDIGSTGIYM